MLVWMALVVCALLDGAIGEYVISGPDWVQFDERGWITTRTALTPTDWMFAAGLLLFQAALIAILIRLQKSKEQISLFPPAV